VAARRLDPDLLLRLVVGALQREGRLAASKAAGLASLTLEANTQSDVIYRTGGATVTIDWPYFWAGILHDGRGSVRAKRVSHLIYFRNPDNDPRIGGPARRYPRKTSDIKRLTKKQFQKWQRINKRYPPGQEPMVVVRSVGPSFGIPFLELPASPIKDFERVGADRAAELAAEEFTRRLDEATSFTERLSVRF
jgi:hypothetical protein